MLHIVLASLLVSAPALTFPHLPKSSATPSLPTRQFAYDMRTKNLDDVLAMYTTDAIFTDPEGHTFGSPEALRQLYEQVFATYDSELEFTRVGLKLKGDPNSSGSTAVETDSFHENLRTRKTDAVVEHCGTCVFTWVRQDDGRWTISSQVWSDKPCPATPAH
jgi:ketosteroid isomerase-like protein